MPKNLKIQKESQDKKHRFIKYRKVYVYFVYSLIWKATKISWHELCSEFKSKGWILPRLHDRAGLNGKQQIFANYQPNLVGQMRVLERSHKIQSDAHVVIPVSPNLDPIHRQNPRIKCDLGYTFRIFENGGATCTFRASFFQNNHQDDSSMFERIHQILHLVRNIDYRSPERQKYENNKMAVEHLTDTYLLMPQAKTATADEDWSLYPLFKSFCTLHDLFRIVSKDPPAWLKLGDSTIWDENGALDRDDLDQDFQSPFIITVAEVTPGSYVRFRERPSLASSREVASILCKLTLDNRRIKRDFLNLSEDYIAKTLDYDPIRNKFLNYCLDHRLFFAFSKRGAIAITADLADIPSCFVVPSFLNLLEIIRTRWYMCCILNMETDRLIDRIGKLKTEIKKNDLLGLTINAEIIDSLFLLRKSYTRLLRDPVPYLFDSGSVTEIAKKASTELGLTDLSDTLHRKMDVLDSIRLDLEAKERLVRRDKYDKELQRMEQNAGEKAE